MKKIGERISYKDHGDFFTIIISTKIDKWKENSMLVWLVAWTFCGVIFMYNLFNDSLNGDERLFIMIFLIFWMYFEIKILRAYLWRRFGIEYIKIDEDRFSIKKSIKGYGKATEVFTSNVKKFSPIELKEKSFSKVFNDTFWMIGKGIIHIESKDIDMYLGIQLEFEDASKLSKELTKMIKKFHRPL